MEQASQTRVRTFLDASSDKTTRRGSALRQKKLPAELAKAFTRGEWALRPRFLSPGNGPHDPLQQNGADGLQEGIAG